MVRTSTEALGLLSASFCMWGRASRMAVLRACILPSAAMDPDVSAIQMKCRGRVANSPPGRFMVIPPRDDFFTEMIHLSGDRRDAPSPGLS